MSNLESTSSESISTQHNRLSVMKRYTDDLIHETIHDLHEISKPLENLTPADDSECLRSIEKALNILVSYIRIRHALDIE